MSRTVLKFPTIVELIDFSLVMKVKIYEVNRTQLTMIASFPKDDIELAIKAYKAALLQAGSGI